MKKIRLLFSSLALIFGGAIVVVSLMSAASSQAYQDERMSGRKLYLGKEILPDHLFYPVLVAADKARLVVAEPVDKIYLKIDYSNRRLGYAKQLLLDGEVELAQSTLTKSQKYLNSAVHDTLDGEFSLEVRQYVIASADYNLGELQPLLDVFLSQQKSVVEALRDETYILKERLERVDKHAAPPL